MSDHHSELASAITSVLLAAQKAGLQLDIRVGVAAHSEGKASLEPLRVETPSSRLLGTEEKLLHQLKRAPLEPLTLTDFASAIGIDEAEARAGMRGDGRSSASVKDVLYERFDTPRREGGKVRTYRLTPKGREFVQGI